MNYTINVAMNGRHYFATAEHSLTTKSQALELFYRLKHMFPEDQGYAMTLRRVETRYIQEEV